MEIRSVKNKPGAVEHYKYYSEKGHPIDTPDNGVAPTFWLYKLNPDVEKLSGLARFLYENLNGHYVGSGMSHPAVPKTVCYNGLTEADMMRRERRPNAENFVRAYNLENEPCNIPDWRYRYIELNETDTDYLNSIATEIIAAGAKKIQIGKNVFEVSND